MENDMEVLFSVTMQQKMASCKLEEMTFLKEEVLVRIRNVKVYAVVGVTSAWKAATAVLHIGAGLILLKEICQQRAWVKRTSTMKQTCLRSEANKQLKLKIVISLEAQLGQRVADKSFFIVTSLDTETILGTAYINKNIEKIKPKSEVHWSPQFRVQSQQRKM